MHPTSMQEHTFTVEVNTNEGETVCVVGNRSELGEWLHKNAVPLTKISESMEGEVWSTKLLLPQKTTIEYRYFICVIIEPPALHEKQFIVRRWETHLKPRVLVLDQKNEHKVERFGYVGDMWKIENGWLTAESVVQLKLYNNPVQIWKKRYADKFFSIKVTPVDLERRDSATNLAEESTNDDEYVHQNTKWPLVELAVMNVNECEFKAQDQFGRVYFPDEFMLFQAQMLHPDTIAYMVDFYLFDPSERDEKVQEHVGFCYILPSILRNTSGNCLVPITGLRKQPIGQLIVEYLVVKPMKMDCDMRVSYSKYWRSGRPSLEVGHRGAGNSYTTCPKHCATVRENTIASLKLAADHGADFVEFDVQLSKDLIPVIYHDFHVCIAMKKKRTLKEHDLLEIPVKDLTLAQLQMLKLIHVSKKHHDDSSEVVDEEEHEEQAPFPTLKQVLEDLPLHCGCNVEIKCTMQLKDGRSELENPFEVNMYLDYLVECVLKYAGNRRIVFSCFHPDVCTMIRLKQNKYPTLFLTQGQSSKHAPYLDSRTHSIPMAIYFARSAGILGIDVHTEDILKDNALVKMAKDSNLVIFCWGDDNNDPSVMNLMRQLGLDGIIYDRINEHRTSRDNVFMMEARQRASLIQATGSDVSATASYFSGTSISSLED